MTEHFHTPEDPRVFVFGSNLLGIHGAGAARYAAQELGFPKTPCGRKGRAYAIPTCEEPGKPLPLWDIGCYVGFFMFHARKNPQDRFFVSAIGCGFAGYKESDIAPLFKGCPENCDLPPGWREMCSRS